jgi:hypothetical protein
MPPRTAIKFHEMLAWLMTEVKFGRAHFSITRALTRANRAVLDTAPRFFEMTFGAHADLAVLVAARLFDRTGRVSIHNLLSLALNQAGTFKYGKAAEVKKAVAESKTSIAALEPIIRAIRTRRNETIAHADARPLVNPAGYIEEGSVSFLELGGLFEKTGSILNRFYELHQGASVILDLEDAKDYEKLFSLLSVAVRIWREGGNSASG